MMACHTPVQEADMEHSLLDTVGMLGLDVILIATLVLFALHAIETWGSRQRRIDVARRESDETVYYRMHDLPRRLRHATTDEPGEEPQRRAA
jgi:hypothetical protein